PSASGFMDVPFTKPSSCSISEPLPSGS
ncbi:hypothetical protein NPIL_52251, partial [Nephila pilipes]